MTVRERVIQDLFRLSSEQVEALRGMIQSMLGESQDETEYDESKDGTIGIISGPTDFARRAEEIIAEDVARRGSWTQKED
jgi:hypothetical protein